MPIIDHRDAADVEEQFKRTFAAHSNRRADELRKLFVEKPDFEPVLGSVSLAKATELVWRATPWDGVPRQGAGA